MSFWDDLKLMHQPWEWFGGEGKRRIRDSEFGDLLHGLKAGEKVFDLAKPWRPYEDMKTWKEQGLKKGLGTTFERHKDAWGDVAEENWPAALVAGALLTGGALGGAVAGSGGGAAAGGAAAGGAAAGGAAAGGAAAGGAAAGGAAGLGPVAGLGAMTVTAPATAGSSGLAAAGGAAAGAGAASADSGFDWQRFARMQPQRQQPRQPPEDSYAEIAAALSRPEPRQMRSAANTPATRAQIKRRELAAALAAMERTRRGAMGYV